MKNISNNTPWYDKSKKDLMLNHSKGWDCPDCGVHLPSGIFGISSHWAQCGGREMHENIVDFFDRKSNDFNELKKIISMEICDSCGSGNNLKVVCADCAALLPSFKEKRDKNTKECNPGEDI